MREHEVVPGLQAHEGSQTLGAKQWKAMVTAHAFFGARPVGRISAEAINKNRPWHTG